MAGGLRVGDLYVAVTASVGEALSNLGKVVEAVEKAAKQVKEKSKGLGEIGAAVAAGIAGAVAAASKSNAAMERETERMTALLYTLAADIGDAFLPVVKRVADGVERVVASFQALSPDVKAAAVNLLTWVAGAGLAAGALGKVAGVVEAFAGGAGLLVKVFGALDKSVALTSLAASVDKVTASLGGLTLKAPSTMGSLGRLALSFGSLLVPLAAVAAAVAALVLLAGSVYAAWEDSSTGLADFFRDMGDQLAKWAGRIADGFTRAFVALGDFVKQAALSVLEGVAALVRGVSRLLEPVARQAGFPELAATFRQVSTLTGRELLDTLGQGAQVLWDGAKQTAAAVGDAVAGSGAALTESVAYGLRTSAAGAKRLGADLARALNLEGLTGQIQALLAKLAGGTGGASGKARIREPTDKAGLEAAQKQAAAEQAALAKLQAQANEESRKEYLASVRAEEAAGAAAFHEMRLEAESLAAAAEAAMESARAALVDRFIGGLGQLGDLINAAVQGMQAGGAYGAIIAVVGELLMQSKGFAGVIEAVNTLIQHVADALGTLLEPLQPLLKAITLIVDGFLNALTPVFEMLGETIEPLVPPLVVLGDIVKGLAPLFEVLGRVFLLIQQPLSILGGPVMKALFTALKFVGAVVLTIAKAIGEVWNAVVGAVQAVIRAISSLIDWTGFDGLKKFARSLNRLKVDTDSMGDSLQVLEDTTWDSARARAEETAQVDEHTEAVARATAALTNVPSAWKVALRRFESEDTQDGPTVPPKPKPTSPSPGAAPESPEESPPTAPVPEWLLGMFPPALRQLLQGGTAPTPLQQPGAGNVSALAAPVTYNITGYDIDAAMEATRRDEVLRRQRTSVRTAGIRIPLMPRFSGS
ncbi:hypothetical protein [Corallococcus sp. Z5C101001]|uniref:hypothetical protein n=1 Tax=Corallococcus sp. Z5C101001 TaxID=2596829 RepID=UPI001180E87F|nr:hypothetical protein [Corallococcus sp. Z5C101001]TSC20325.1 hypothetical protein FOF48_35690 [Corallococcus sp. Z5C101001]